VIRSLPVSVDVLIIGGGLAGSLAAWRLATLRPELQVRLIEAGNRLGGNHTWSFHDTDLAPEARAWLAPLIVGSWPRHEVRFPKGRRVLSGGYASITSSRVHDVIAHTLGERIQFDTSALPVDATSVTLASGVVTHAGLVIDARGDWPVRMPVGWQTFLGQDLELEVDHGIEAPILMDATVPQRGGFRFIYVLPWSARRVLVEDTLYADTPVVDRAACRQAIATYVRQRGWRVRQPLGEESGALPIPLGGRGEAFWPDRTVRIGVRAGLFHPTTGYSLADAVATAELLARMDLRDVNGVYHTMRQTALRAWRNRRFFRLLNRLLFRAADPGQRRGVLEQFYQRPEEVIARFYAARLSWFDQCRLLTGRPPVPVTRALAQLRAERS